MEFGTGLQIRQFRTQPPKKPLVEQKHIPRHDLAILLSMIYLARNTVALYVYDNAADFPSKPTLMLHEFALRSLALPMQPAYDFDGGPYAFKPKTTILLSRRGGKFMTEGTHDTAIRANVFQKTNQLPLNMIEEVKERLRRSKFFPNLKNLRMKPVPADFVK